LTALRSQVSALGLVSSSLKASKFSETEPWGNAAIDGVFGTDPFMAAAKVFALRQERSVKNASAKMLSSLESDAS
jgi:hypothetical protein